MSNDAPEPKFERVGRYGRHLMYAIPPAGVLHLGTQFDKAGPARVRIYKEDVPTNTLLVAVYGEMSGAQKELLARNDIPEPVTT